MKKQIEFLLLKSNPTNYQISKETGISAVVLGKYTNGVSDIGRMTLDNAIKLYTFFNNLLKAAEGKFGSIDFEGKTYILLDQAELSGRQLLDWQTEEGYAHFTAPAIDNEGDEYQVEWVLKLVHEDGSEIEDLSDLDWDSVDQVVEV